MSALEPHEVNESTLSLVREALAEGRELIKLEVALATQEIEAELAQARKAMVGWALALCSACAGVTMALVAVAMLTPAPVLALLVAAGVLLVVAGGAALVAMRRTPTGILTRTRLRLETDLRAIERGAEWHIRAT